MRRRAEVISLHFFAARVVSVARGEQEATIMRATAVIPNTLILVASDFPVVNKNIPDHYTHGQVDALFAAAKNLWEQLMLSVFYYTWMREDEVAHLYWSDIRWNEREIGSERRPRWAGLLKHPRTASLRLRPNSWRF